MDISGLQEEMDYSARGKYIRINISQDHMEATMFLSTPNEDETYTLDEIKTALRDNEVKMGIIEGKIEDMIKNQIYETAVLIAEGKQAENGKDGSYEYPMKSKVEFKPKVLPDGSVDYLNVQMFEMVQQGDVVAIYTPPTNGVFGFDVSGKLKVPKPGRPMMVLRGRGFVVSDDKTTYTANTKGKIEYRNGEIIINDVYEVNTDVDFSHGNIDFDGDVQIKGNVVSGISITASGNVLIDGHVGGASIKAGKDIILSEGVQAKGCGRIEAQGNISAKFFENAKVRAKGEIKASYILNSDVYSESKITVEGRKATILGGNVHGVKGIETYNCGNEAYMITNVATGVTKEITASYNKLLADIKAVDKEVKLLTEAMDKLNKLKAYKPEAVNQENYTRVFQAKVIKTAQRSKLEEQRRAMYDLICTSNSSEIVIHNVFYPNVRIFINGIIYESQVATKEVAVRKFNDEIVVRGLDDNQGA